MQLMHVGRMSHPDNTPHHRQAVAPSAIAPGAPMFTAKGMQEIPAPRALGTDEVRRIIQEFRYAAYGQLVLANPDFVERLKTSAPMNTARRDTFYGGAAQGYTDYPTLNDARAA